MEALPSLAEGFVRISVMLPQQRGVTPGDLVQATGVPPEHVSHIVVQGSIAYVDVAAEHGRQARAGLQRFGQTQLVERNWRWLRIGLGRNHGLAMGQLRRILQQAGATPVGRIQIQNTHTLVGLSDDRLPAVMQWFAERRINGFPARVEALPPGDGPGPAEYVPKGKRPGH